MPISHSHRNDSTNEERSSRKLSDQVMSLRGCGLERPPFGPAASRTTFTCPFRDRPGLLHRGVPPQASSLRPISRKERMCHLPTLPLTQLEAVVSSLVANALHDKTSGGHLPRRSSRHRLPNDTPGIRTACPI